MGAWEDGRRAWQRLDGWDEDRTHSAAGGGAALAALSDIGTVRRLLDQAEPVSVKVARRNGKSWAEIATKLGVTRQSAWERWRDLDETAPDGPRPADVVTDQSPESGATVQPGSPVTLWVERGGGGAGVREPRRPKPNPREGMRPDPQDVS